MSNLDMLVQAVLEDPDKGPWYALHDEAIDRQMTAHNIWDMIVLRAKGMPYYRPRGPSQEERVAVNNWWKALHKGFEIFEIPDWKAHHIDKELNRVVDEQGRGPYKFAEAAFKEWMDPDGGRYAVPPGKWHKVAAHKLGFEDTRDIYSVGYLRVADDGRGGLHGDNYVVPPTQAQVAELINIAIENGFTSVVVNNKQRWSAADQFSEQDPRLDKMLYAVMAAPVDEAGWGMLHDFVVESRIPKSVLFNRLFWVWAETHGWAPTAKDMDRKEWQAAYDGFIRGIDYLTTRLGYRSEKDTHFSEQDSRLLKKFLFENPSDQAGRNAYIDSMIENRMSYEAAAQEAQETCWDGFINLLTTQPGKQTVDGFVQFLTGPPRNWSREQAIKQVILQRFGHSPQLNNYQHVLSMTLDHPSGESIGDATLNWLATAPEADIIRWADEEEDTHEAEAQYAGEPQIYEADAYIVQTNEAVEHILDELVGPGATYRDLQEYCQGEIEAEDLDAPAPLKHGWYVQGDQEPESGTLYDTELEALEMAIEYFGYPEQPYQWEYPLFRRIRQLRAEAKQQPPEQHAEFAEGDPRLDRLAQLIGEDPENQAAWMAYTDQCIELRLSARDAWIYLFDYIIPTDAKDRERRADLVKDRGGYEKRKIFAIHSPEWKALVAGKTKYLGGQYKHNFGVPDTEIKPWLFAEYGPTCFRKH